MRFLLILVLGIWGQAVAGQETFNKRYDFSYLGAVLTSVHPTDSCYFAVGIVADSVPPYATGNIFARVGLDGEIQVAKSLADPSVDYETWFNTLQPFEDSLFILAGQLFDSIGKTVLIKFTPEGDTVSTRTFTNPFLPAYDWMHPVGGLVRSPDGGLVISNLISNSPFGTPDLYVLKVDADGEMVWGGVLEDGSGERDLPAATIPMPDGGQLVGLWRTNMNLVQDGFTSQLGLARVSPEGEVSWEFLSPLSMGLLDGANEMVLLDDGSLVIATGRGTEIEGPSVNTIYFDKMAMKLTPEHDVEWEVVFEEHGLNLVNKFTKVVEVTNGSGFVFAGADWEPLPSSNAIRGYFAKVNQDGEVGWIRRYVGLDSELPFHQVYDIDETPDGGFIVCGESRDATNETLPPQQGWLLKLDKHGCLIPGCHLFDAVEEKEEIVIELAIYPNPTADYLNFQLRGSRISANARFRIIDAHGKTVREFESRIPHETHIVPVWDWQPGIYFLQYLENGEMRATERFVVGR